MMNVLSAIFCIVVGIEFITLLFLFILGSMYSLTTDLNIEKRRAKQEKRDEEYHKARMKDLMR
ncbi:MAG: hypothetical protein ACOX1E_00770 [Erysipelotrichaceae bacterium]|jgi:hypothetical protein